MHLDAQKHGPGPAFVRSAFGVRRTIAGSQIEHSVEVGHEQGIAKIGKNSSRYFRRRSFFFVALHIVAFIRVLMLKGTGIALDLVTVTIRPSSWGSLSWLADMLPHDQSLSASRLSTTSRGKRSFILW